jgi:DNA replication protein DnaC
MNLDSKLKSLRLSGIVNVLPVRNQEAIHAKLSYPDFLEILVDDELARRKGRLIERRRQLAHFPTFKTLDGFDWEFNPKINRRQMFDLATCRFVPAGENVLFLGQPGVGKSHLAIALGMQAIRSAYSVRYYSVYDFIEALADAEIGGLRRQFLAEMARVNLLILDEFGMKKLPLSAGEDLLEIVTQRYEKAATIVTTNRPMEDWGKVLGDNPTATGILDRLLHHAHVINITGKSYRLAKRSTLEAERETK